MSQEVNTKHEVNTKFKFNDAEYEFDMRDADDAEKYERVIELMQEDEKKIPMTGKLYEIYKAQCKMLKKFFDNCLEEGAGEKICTEKNNITVHYTAYQEFLEFVRLQKEDIIRMKNALSKYSNRNRNQKHKYKKK